MTQEIHTDNIVLKGIASTLNGCGRLMVLGYDLGAAGHRAARQKVRNISWPSMSLCKKRAGEKEEIPKAYQKEARKLARRHEKAFSHVIEDIDHAIKEVVPHMTAEEFAALEPVILDLFDHEMEIKILSAIYLGEAKNPHTIPILDAALGFEDPALTDAIVTAMHLIDKGCIDPILEELVESPDTAIRLTALTHLDKINSPDLKQACLEALLEDESPEVRTAAENLASPDTPDAPGASQPDDSGQKRPHTAEELKRMVKPELVEMAKSMELRVSSKMKKDDIIQLILDHSPPKP